MAVENDTEIDSPEPEITEPLEGDAEESSENEVLDPSAETKPDDLRLTASALLLGGLGLVLLGQATATAAENGERFWVYLITAFGVAAFLLGGSMVARRSMPQFAEKPVMWLADKFDIAAGQLFLLLLALCFALLASYAAGDNLQARSAAVSIVAWLVAILCAVAGTVRSGQDAPPHMERSDILFTGAVFGLALLLRGLGTELIPTTLSGDEGAAGLSAVQFANGQANNLFTVGWFDFPSLFFALQSVGIRLLGHTIPALRLMSAIGGALTVAAVYWLARAMFDRFIARLAALILLASHFHIHISRIGLNNVWDGFFAVTAAFGLWVGWKTGRRYGFIICGLALGLGQYFYVTMRILPLLFLIWAAAAWLVQRERFRERLPALLLTAFIAFIVFLPMGAYFTRHSDQYMARIMPVTVSGDWLNAETSSNGANGLQVIGQQLVKAAGGFVYEPLRLLYNPGVPLLLVTAASLFLIGVLWALLNLDLRYLLLLLPLAATIFIVAVSQDAPSSQRYILAIPFVVIFVALPLGLLRDWLRELWPEYGRLAALPAIILVASLMLVDLRYYFTQAYSDGYVLGGRNTEVATQVAGYLTEQESGQDVYFFGFPRMGYHSHATIPYLLPQMRGYDIQPDGGIPSPDIVRGTTQFIFLPERLAELQPVMELYPEGDYQEFVTTDNELLFAVYEVGSP